MSRGECDPRVRRAWCGFASSPRLRCLRRRVLGWGGLGKKFLLTKPWRAHLKQRLAAFAQRHFQRRRTALPLSACDSACWIASGPMVFPSSRRVPDAKRLWFFCHHSWTLAARGHGRGSSSSKATFSSAGSSVGPVSTPSGLASSKRSAASSTPVMRLNASPAICAPM